MKKSKADKQMEELGQTPLFNTYAVIIPSGITINFPYHGELTPEMIKRFKEEAEKTKLLGSFTFRFEETTPTQ